MFNMLPPNLRQRLNPIWEFVLGSTLFSAPFWQHVFADSMLVFQYLAALCGAIIGIHGVWQILRRYRCARRAHEGAVR
jgi:hypothetical protein